MKATAYGFINEKGELHLHNRKRLQQELRQFRPCDVELIVKKKGKRSTPANAYYWGIVLEEIRLALKEKGTVTDRETLHEAFKLRFNADRTTDTETGEVLLEIGGSTAEMNKDEFSWYLDQVLQWASEKLGLYVSPPNTQTQMDFKDAA